MDLHFMVRKGVSNKMKKRALWLFLMGRFISLIGSGVQSVAMPLFILDATGSGTAMGIFSAFSLIPMIFAAPWAGIIGDRKNRRNVMIAMDFGRGAVICCMGLLAMMNCFNIYMLFGLQIFISVMDSLFNASSQALLPDLISSEQLIDANSKKGGLDAAAFIIGPALGGVVYGFWGIKLVFLINGISFFLSGILAMFIQYRHYIQGNAMEKIKLKTFVAENMVVLKFIRTKKGLMQLFTFAMISNLLLAPMFDIVFPYALKKGIGFSSREYGYLMGFFTIGLLIGNIAISMKLKSIRLKKLMRTGLVLETIVTLLLSAILFPKMVSWFGGAGILLFSMIAAGAIGMGFFNALVNTPISTNLQNMVPQEMRSRFFSILGMFSQGAIPVGSLVFGIMLDLIKYYHMMAAVNIIAAIVAGVFLLKACDEAYEAAPAS